MNELMLATLLVYTVLVVLLAVLLAAAVGRAVCEVLDKLLGWLTRPPRKD